MSICVAALVVSAIGAEDRFTWFLETVPAMMAIVILTATYRRFPLTDLVYILILIHALILMAGGHYTYAKVPFGFWLRDALHLDRNPYDRIGHFAQGFVPAMIAREIVIRKKVINGAAWRAFFIVALCLAISAFYELVEWRTSVASGEAADAFLGSQGDIWDSQWDMTCALIGAITALALLGRVHDRKLRKLL